MSNNNNNNNSNNRKQPVVNLNVNTATNAGRRRNRRRRRRGNNWENVNTPVNISVQPQTNGGTRAATQGRRQRNRTRTSGVLARARTFALTESLSMQKSVSNLLHNLFVPSHGLHRGIANGAELSALCHFKTSKDVTLPAGSVASFVFYPDLAADFFMGAIMYSTTATSPTVQNPMPTSLPAGYQQVVFTGPFQAVNPALSPSGSGSGTYRVVSFQLKIINVTALAQKGGELVVAYTPALTDTTHKQDPLTTEFSRTSIDQLAWSLPISAEHSVVANWVPNAEENLLEAYTPSGLSAILGYVITPGSGAQTFRFEYDVGIEYIPNMNYRPFVDRHLPTTNPAAWYHVNQELANHWDSWVLLPLETYNKHVAMIEGLGTASRPYTQLNGMGSLGNGGRLVDNDVIEEFQEEATGESLWDRYGPSVANAARDTLCYATGNQFSFCNNRGMNSMLRQAQGPASRMQAIHDDYAYM